MGISKQRREGGEGGDRRKERKRKREHSRKKIFLFIYFYFLPSFLFSFIATFYPSHDHCRDSGKTNPSCWKYWNFLSVSSRLNSHISSSSFAACSFSLVFCITSASNCSCEEPPPWGFIRLAGMASRPPPPPTPTPPPVASCTVAGRSIRSQLVRRSWSATISTGSPCCFALRKEQRNTQFRSQKKKE